MTDFPEGARLFPGSHGGGTLLGGPPRVTWHITWDRLDPRPTFDGVAGYLVSKNFEPTILWNPEDGDIIGLVPASRSAYAVRNLAGGVETNRYGAVHVQIEVFFSPGYKDRALFTDGPLVGLDRIMAWLDDLGVPRTAACDWANPSRDVNQWLNNAGHFGHFAVPENDHSDPIKGTDIAKILAVGQALPDPQEDTMRAIFFKEVTVDAAGAEHPVPGIRGQAVYLSTDELTTCRWIQSTEEENDLKGWYNDWKIAIIEMGIRHRPPLIGPEPS